MTATKKKKVAMSDQMKKYLAGAAVYAVIAAVVIFGHGAQPGPGPVPSVDILGPVAVKTGDLAVFTANESSAKDHAWTILPEVPFEQLESKHVIVTTFPKAGQYTIILAACTGRSVAIAKHVVTVSGDSPVPPGPGPEPEPEPDPQPDEGWAKWTRDTVLAEVPAEGRAEAAVKLAGALRTLAAKIAAGGVADTKQARVELRAISNASLGKDAYKWVGFSLKYVSHIEALAEAGKMETLKQYQSVYEGIAAGLALVAKEGK